MKREHARVVSIDEVIHLTRYRTPDDLPVSPVARRLPTLFFYSRFLYLVVKTATLIRLGRARDRDLYAGCWQVVQALERVGVRVTLEGMEHYRTLEGPCVFVGNHMSSLETFALPAVLMPHRKVTFIVKRGLVTYPVFKHVMRYFDPITVGRTNPREDLRAMLSQGLEKLKRGVSIVVFPQATRTTQFDRRGFNSIGAKLAARAGVPIVPVAVKTDAWGNGRWLKDFGRIDPTKRVYIGFGKPIIASGNGKAAHRQVLAFIEGRLAQVAV